MANSKVASLTEFGVYSDGLAGDDGRRALVPSLESGRVDGLQTPSICSSESHDGSVAGVVLRDPEAILKGLLSCDVELGRAMDTLDKYYDAVIHQSGDVASEVCSVSSRASRRHNRQQLWRAEAGAMSQRKGYCYLKPVAWGRRKYIAVLGECPTMRDFISSITPEDLDFELSMSTKVYRLPTVKGQTLVAYHMADSYEHGTCIGSFRAVVQSLLRSYPWLNGRDFGSDQLLATNLPLVGGIVDCDDYFSAQRSLVNEDIHPGGTLAESFGDGSHVACAHSSIALSEPVASIPAISLDSRVGAEAIHVVMAEQRVQRYGELKAAVSAMMPVSLVGRDSPLLPPFSGRGFSVTVAIAPIGFSHQLQARSTSPGACFRVYLPGNAGACLIRASDDVSDFGRFREALLRRSQFVDGVVTLVHREAEVQMSILLDATDDWVSFAWNMLSESGLTRILSQRDIDRRRMRRSLPVGDSSYPVHVLTHLVGEYLSTSVVDWDTLRDSPDLSDDRGLRRYVDSMDSHAYV